VESQKLTNNIITYNYRIGTTETEEL
jgi:hypothetical protein